MPGYQGSFCRQVCKEGFFGNECSRSCGKCRNKQTCHHINGSCLNGCDEGVQGWNCTTVPITSEEPQTVAIIGGIVAVIVVILIAVAVVFLYKRLNPRIRRQETAGNKRTDSWNIRMKEKRITDNKIIEQQRPDQKNEDSEYYTELQVSNEACQYEVLKNCLK
uniref:Platelet endothelial aggregation receptor 1-like isoform X2 n=1 Tax=Crassostrea virginica TaxID=6565 RepID=A0A8B8CB13_CRAVI|nr:platelet endothelial aggregation receptor 1-like isoform X2 [Crassostrea virginica]